MPGKRPRKVKTDGTVNGLMQCLGLAFNKKQGTSGPWRIRGYKLRVHSKKGFTHFCGGPPPLPVVYVFPDLETVRHYQQAFAPMFKTSIVPTSDYPNVATGNKSIAGFFN